MFNRVKSHLRGSDLPEITHEPANDERTKVTAFRRRLDDDIKDLADCIEYERKLEEKLVEARSNTDRQRAQIKQRINALELGIAVMTQSDLDELYAARTQRGDKT